MYPHQNTFVIKGVDAVCISNDGNIIVSGSADKIIKIWSISGTLIRILYGCKCSMHSNDGSTIVSGWYYKYMGDKVILNIVGVVY